MYDTRNYTDRYDLHRPTVSKSASHEQTIAVPREATASDERCRFFHAGGQFAVGQSGVTLDYDAAMLVPAAADLRPEKAGRQPDVIAHAGRWWTVLGVHPMAGQSVVSRVLLRERKAPA